jgi:hypothetical protein
MAVSRVKTIFQEDPSVVGKHVAAYIRKTLTCYEVHCPHGNNNSPGPKQVISVGGYEKLTIAIPTAITINVYTAAKPAYDQLTGNFDAGSTIWVLMDTLAGPIVDFISSHAIGYLAFENTDQNNSGEVYVWIQR